MRGRRPEPNHAGSVSVRHSRLPGRRSNPDVASATAILGRAAGEGRTALAAAEVASLLASLGVAVDAGKTRAPGARFALGRIVLDCVCAAAALTVVAAQCEIIGAPLARPLPRPIGKIDQLLHPARLGIVGVSPTGANFARIILRNMVGSGYPKERITIIRTGETGNRVVDAGRLYDAMAARLMDQGVRIFRNCARATTALVHHLAARRYAATLSATSEEPR